MHVEHVPHGGDRHFGVDIWDRLVRFAQLLESEGELRGLIGPREMDKLWSRHILNSTAILDFVPENSSLIDVGSGAGFPGIVTAITRPDVTIHLIDSLGRRTDWLSYVVQDLDLPNVFVHHNRAEELHGQLVADIVTARAVAALKKLLPWTMPLVKSKGQLVALKGGRAEQEIDDAHKELRKFKAAWAEVHDIDVWGADEGTRVVVVEKL
ncbi:16S rRNA (guanine(527)-N(7))-methyltransferase RsmG [Arcanobacterium phocisimile]|uniref:Ribosomal RNA small subunit methyltransferase G n=1 Tax=Arcanobacterium phocisimile TaxID=1302235 RepID=A0ABX7IJB4_9ACTO|nr:16S rRNA (guanine(527)-N(7))-methyltransferase RsmG [Arcanobacterium phocisimile]QRV02180.1 16S rRNA (guanine(527)-N(7))-methyltransferase RsmG [Arcanobacterium phocisimile]